MTLFDKDLFKINFKEENKLLKDNFIEKLDCLFKDVYSLTDVNKNIYNENNALTLSSKNKVENNLKESIKYNEFLSKENPDINLINKNIIKEYKRITGISICRTENMNLKIIFDFLSKNNEYYIIISIKNSNFDVVEIIPKEINFRKYHDESYKVKDINIFLCKLINYELIPHFQNKFCK